MTAATRALVTGAGGFIGSHFVRYLATRGWAVRAIDVRSPAAGLDGGIEYRIQDIRDEVALSAALEGVDYVFNLASVHLDVRASFEQFQAVNVRALGRLVELSAAARVKRKAPDRVRITLVRASTSGGHSSSSSVIGRPARECHTCAGVGSASNMPMP